MSGETTTVRPGRISDGSWYRSDLPLPVGITASTSRPLEDVLERLGLARAQALDAHALAADLDQRAQLRGVALLARRTIVGRDRQRGAGPGPRSRRARATGGATVAAALRVRAFARRRRCCRSSLSSPPSPRLLLASLASCSRLFGWAGLGRELGGRPARRLLGLRLSPAARLAAPQRLGREPVAVRDADLLVPARCWSARAPGLRLCLRVGLVGRGAFPGGLLVTTAVGRS